MGKLGFRGRYATPEERARILDAFFFEGDRRAPYLQQYFVLMLLSATIAGFGLANDSAAVVIGAMGERAGSLISRPARRTKTPPHRRSWAMADPGNAPSRLRTPVSSRLPWLQVE